MSVANQIEQKLTSLLHPVALEVEDESHKHKGHAGAREGGETHFRVTITAEAFRGQSRVACHRLVTNALGELIGNPIHALSITARAPDQP
ncbi:MAG: BolA family transcriptional regulator [Parvibaculaceae bacterium]|nr:BolA family transcriptional regulator [Parvibaculaceae bacterium]